MKSNVLTIIKKEFARFFGDRQLLFTAVIMPGLLIYVIYSLMGSGMEKMMNDGADDLVTLRVENMPRSLTPLFDSLTGTVSIEQPFLQPDIDALADKDLDAMLVRFPAGFDSLIASYSPQSGSAAPNVEIYYNSANEAVSRAFNTLTATLAAFEDQMSNRFDVNRADSEETVFNQATDDQVLGDILSKLIPMLILMLLFSGVMAIAPSTIAGEKERGTIATLLVTPMRRNELALGKVISLSCIALLSGISSFIGIILSLPKMMPTEADINFSGFYTANDYLVLLLVIFATVLVMATAVSLLSALAKDMKNAGTMITPLMLAVMFCGLIPMFQGATPTGILPYLIPFYNSIEVMTAVFAHELQWTPVLVTLGANVGYMILGVWGLTRMFNSEKVMFSR
jgi:sodium transport system permease protein